MKLTKRIFSIFMALALVVGTVAVAANADASLTQFAGSVLTYTATSDKTTDGVTKVQIGDTITISVYMQTNYYVGATGGELFMWSSGIFNALGSNYTVNNVVSKYANTINNPFATSGYPAGYAAADYVAFQIARAHSGEHTATEDCVTPQLIYTFTFSVPNDATLVGKTAQFFMPAASVRSATVTGRKAMIYQSVNSTDSNLGSTTVANPYAETVNVASMSIEIVAAAPTVCDYTNLQAKYDACDELAYASEYYDATAYATYTTALQAAADLLAVKESAPLAYSEENQASLDNAATALETAYNALSANFVSLAALNAAVTASATPAFAEEFYPAAKYAAWETAYENAVAGQTTYATAADTQANRDLVAGLATALTNAFAALTPEYVDLTALEAAVDACDTLSYDKEYYDNDKWNTWDNALTAANNGLTTYANAANTTANQTAVAGLATSLSAAYAALTPSFLDLTTLNNAIAACDEPAYGQEFYAAAAYSDWGDALDDAQSAVTAYANAANTAANRAIIAEYVTNLQDTFNALVPAFVDLTALNTAVENYDAPAYDEEFYDATEYAAWSNALVAAQAGKTTYANVANTQANRDAVAALVTALTNTYNALDARFVSLTDLQAAVDECDTLAYAKEYYNNDKWNDWDNALLGANNGLTTYSGAADTTANRNAVAGLAETLRAKYAALVPAFLSLTALNNAIDACDTPAYAQEFYSAGAYSDWSDALDDAQSAATAYDGAADTAANRLIISDYITNLQDAFDALVPDFVDLEDLNAAVTGCDTPAMAAEFYNASDYAAWQSALSAAQTAQTTYATAANTQANRNAVAAAASALRSAFAALDAAFVDVSALRTAVDNSDAADYAEEYYDATAYAAWEEALSAAQAGLTTYAGAPDTQANRDAVDDLVTALNEAYEALTPAFIDLADLEEVIGSCDVLPYAEEYYLAADYSEWEDALSDARNAVTAYTNAADTQANRDIVDGYADALQTIYDGISAHFIDLTDLSAAISECDTPAYGESYYDVDDYSAWEDALTEAENAVDNYVDSADTPANRQLIANLASGLRAAFAALVPNIVDTDALEESISECDTPAYAEEYYDATEYAAWLAALEAANDAITELNGKPDSNANRLLVSTTAAALNSAFAALDARFVSYTALESAISSYGTTPLSQGSYVASTYAAWLTARNAANNLISNKPTPVAPASDTETQTAIDNAAEELRVAYQGLEVAACHILDITPSQEHYLLGDTINFSIHCDGTNFVKMQIKTSDGGTMTYTRSHSAVVSITDNGDGTETWVITAKVYANTFTYSARAKFENTANGWDVGYCDFHGQTSTGDDATVKSAEIAVSGTAVNSLTTNDLGTITIVTGKDTLRIRLVDALTGGTMTYKAPKSVNEDGTKVWVINRRFGVRSYTYQILTADSTNQLTATGDSLTFNVTKYVPAPVVPSTGNAEDTVISVNAAARIRRCTNQTFTVVTDKNCSGFRLVDAATGKPVAVQRAGGVTQGNTTTWTLVKFYNYAATFNYKVEALYGTQWVDSGKTVSFTVAY